MVVRETLIYHNPPLKCHILCQGNCRRRNRRLFLNHHLEEIMIVAPIVKSKSFIIFIAQSMLKAKFKNNSKMEAGLQYMMSSWKPRFYDFFVQRFFTISFYVWSFIIASKFRISRVSNQPKLGHVVLTLEKFALLLFFIKKIFKIFLQAKIARFIIMIIKCFFMVWYQSFWFSSSSLPLNNGANTCKNVAIRWVCRTLC